VLFAIISTRVSPHEVFVDGAAVIGVVAFFVAVVEPTSAGTIGAVVSMGKILRAPVAFLNLSLPEHGYHAPNENFDWGQASGGMAAFARYLERVAATAGGRAR